VVVLTAGANRGLAASVARIASREFLPQSLDVPHSPFVMVAIELRASGAAVLLAPH